MSDALKANSTFKKPLTPLALSAAAIAGNLFNITIFYNLDWLFGSIFVMIAVILYGPLWGALTALIASSCNYFICGHPYVVTFYNRRFDIKYIEKDYYKNFLSMSEGIENILNVFLKEHVMHLLRKLLMTFSPHNILLSLQIKAQV